MARALAPAIPEIAAAPTARATSLNALTTSEAMPPASKFPWDQSRLVAAASARRLQLGDRTALFCARRQQLYELNEAADAIWLALASEGSPEGAARALGGGEADAEVLGYVRQAAAGWLSGGQLYPAEILELINGAPTEELTVGLDELQVAIRTYGDADPLAVLAVFGQFSTRAAASESISIVGAGGLIFMFADGQPLGAFNERTWIPELKARLTGRYTQAVDGAFLTHGALLSREGRGLILCGDPGAGKTTLTIGLTQAGFRYHGDDIVRIDETGKAMGAPFSPAVKRGSWALLGDRVPELQKLPVYLRSDGQEVRYLPVAASPREPIAVAAVLLLARQPDAQARVEPIEPLQAITEILGAAYSARGAIDGRTLESLVAAVNKARLGRLCYSGLDEAVGVVSEFTR